jgi:hypothetical protein
MGKKNGANKFRDIILLRFLKKEVDMLKNSQISLALKLCCDKILVKKNLGSFGRAYLLKNIHDTKVITKKVCYIGCSDIDIFKNNGAEMVPNLNIRNINKLRFSFLKAIWGTFSLEVSRKFYR